MAIYSPDIRLNKNDLKLIKEISRLLAPHVDGFFSSAKDISGVEIILSHEEGVRMLEFIRNTMNEMEFQKKIEFTEKIYLETATDNQICKETYKFLRKRNNQSSVMVTGKWHDFLLRVGSVHGHRYTGANARKMTFEHFIKMERKLLKNLDVHPAVINTLIELIELEEDYIDYIRSGREVFGIGKIRQSLSNTVGHLSARVSGNKNIINLSALNMISILGITANAGVMITTRDWSATGTISMITSQAITLKK